MDRQESQLHSLKLKEVYSEEHSDHNKIKKPFLSQEKLLLKRCQTQLFAKINKKKFNLNQEKDCWKESQN